MNKSRKARLPLDSTASHHDDHNQKTNVTTVSGDTKTGAPDIFPREIQISTTIIENRMFL